MSETLANSSALQNEEISSKSDAEKSRRTDSAAQETDLTEDTSIKTEGGSAGINADHAQEGDIEPVDQATANAEEGIAGSNTGNTQEDGTTSLRADSAQKDGTTSLPTSNAQNNGIADLHADNTQEDEITDLLTDNARKDGTTDLQVDSTQKNGAADLCVDNVQKDGTTNLQADNAQEDGAAGLSTDNAQEDDAVDLHADNKQVGDASEQDTVPMAATDNDNKGQKTPPVSAQPLEVPWYIYPLRRLQQQPLSKGVMNGILVLFILSMIGTLVSGVFAINFGVSGYTTYSVVHDQTYNGVQHLLNVKTIFTGINAHPTGFLDVNKLQRAQREFLAAHQNFQQVQYTLDHSGAIAMVNEYLPQYQSQIVAVRAISQIGIDVSDIGSDLISTASKLAPIFRGPLLNNTHVPLVTSATLDLVSTTIDRILPRLYDIQTQSSKFSLSSLPISAHQRDQLTQLMLAIPQAEADLTQLHGLMGAVGWILGINEPRAFLVQTMDRAEIRPTGGFTGQYGELAINGGRVAPFTLKDISLVEYTDNSPTSGLLAPPQYRSWWPFANWGLRDSNLSADFPTSAQIAINKYKSEVGHQADGVILFTPFLIEHVLQVIGPIQVPGYNDTITAQNLEERLHYYQQDSTGLAKQVVYQPGDTTTSSRKRFTSLLAHLLMDRVRHAPPDEIIAIARQMLHDLKTKDLQIYVTNPQIEGLLVQYGEAALIDRSNTHDGLYVVQANVSASKASQFVRTIMHDTVTLDAKGGAKHVLQLRFVYNQLGPVYGYDTYHDYVRVYVPATSKYLWGDGFDTGTPLCGATYVACPQQDVYPKDELLCPAGQFQPGAQAPSIADEDGGRWHPLDTVGPPTNLVSDEPGRAMFGGWVIIPKNCTMTVTLSWYVPAQSPGKPYNLLVQRQAGSFPELDLTILPSPGNCTTLNTAGQRFDGLLLEDASFAVRTMPAHAQDSCYSQPGV